MGRLTCRAWFIACLVSWAVTRNTKIGVPLWICSQAVNTLMAQSFRQVNAVQAVRHQNIYGCVPSERARCISVYETSDKNQTLNYLHLWRIHVDNSHPDIIYPNLFNKLWILNNN